MDMTGGASMSGDQTAFYPPRWKLSVLTLTSAVMTGIGYLASRADNVWLSGLGWVLLIGFGWGTVVMLVRTLRPGPSVILDRNGITDRTTLSPTGLVRWEEITVVRKREIGRGRQSERVLDVMLEDPDGFYARPRSLVRRVSDAYRKAMKHPDVCIPGSMVSRPISEVIRELNRWRPDLQVLELPPKLPKMRILKTGDVTKVAPRPPRW